jgi:hypothetical protein
VAAVPFDVILNTDLDFVSSSSLRTSLIADCSERIFARILICTFERRMNRPKKRIRNCSIFLCVYALSVFLRVNGGIFFE